MTVTADLQKMFQDTTNSFQKRNVHSRLLAHHQFCALEVLRKREQMLTYNNRVQLCISDLKSTDVGVDNKGIAIGIPSGLPSEYGDLVATLITTKSRQGFQSLHLKRR